VRGWGVGGGGWERDGVYSGAFAHADSLRGRKRERERECERGREKEKREKEREI